MPDKISKEPTPRFKPLSDGLGLNHFADGLPYTPMQSSRRKAMVNFNFPSPRAPQAVQALQVKPQVEESPRAEEEISSYAGCLRRILAFSLDLILSIVVFAFIVSLGFRLNGFEIIDAKAFFWPLLLLYAVVYFGYFLIQETSWRRTIGKTLLGMSIRSNDGVALVGRGICFLAAALPFGIGLVWYFFDSKKRCWHDIMTGCEVVQHKNAF